MTLIISITSPDFALIVGDRRLSWNSKIVDEDVGKIGVVNLPDGVLLWAYTGIARARDGQSNEFEARRWIADLLIKCGPPDFKLRNVLSRFCESATKEFKSRGELKHLSSSEKRLTVLFNGFLNDGTMVTGTVSNFEDGRGETSKDAWPEFVHVIGTARAEERKTASLIRAIGSYNGLPKNGLFELNQLLLKGAPVVALRQKANALIKEAALSPSVKNSVGTSLMAGLLNKPRRSEQPAPYASYSPDAPFRRMLMLDQVVLSPAGSFAISDISIEAEDAASNLMAPDQPRNERCVCGSGMKYKKCHGKLRKK